MKIRICCPYCSNYWDETFSLALGERRRQVVTCQKTRDGDTCEGEFVLIIESRAIVTTYSMAMVTLREGVRPREVN